VEHIMFSTPEAFWPAEVEYRRQRIAQDFGHRPRRYRVRRRHHLHLPRPRRGTVAVA
jgi:hypothetical protein